MPRQMQRGQDGNLHLRRVAPKAAAVIVDKVILDFPTQQMFQHPLVALVFSCGILIHSASRISRFQ